MAFRKNYRPLLKDVRGSTQKFQTDDVILQISDWLLLGDEFSAPVTTNLKLP